MPSFLGFFGFKGMEESKNLALTFGRLSRLNHHDMGWGDRQIYPISSIVKHLWLHQKIHFMIKKK
jgi:hypothetical protein